MTQPDRFTDTVDALMRPTPPPPSATIRVADLFSSDGRLGKAAEGAGFRVVYRAEPKNSREKFDFADIPPFDIVTAKIPDGDDEQADALEFVLRFLRVRRPETFLMMGAGWATNGVVYTKTVQDKTTRLGYAVNKTARESDGYGFIVGTQRVPIPRLPEGDERPATNVRSRSRNQPTLPLPPVVEQILGNLN